MLKKIVNIFAFIISGVIAIAVGFFMLRGTMRLWDKKNAEDDSNNKNSEKNKK